MAATEGEALAMPSVEVISHTDPVCSWSWAFEPEWRRLRFEFGPCLGWRYRTGGMIPDWRRFSDPLNAISTPAQMGPHWFQVHTVSGMPLDERIWFEDPPASSYPACMAVQAGERQGPLAGEACLRRAREAVMSERRNIARREVLPELADELATPSTLGVRFDPDGFARDLDGGEAVAAFQDDLKEGAYRDLGRFPTLILRPDCGPAAMLVGYQPYEVLRTALAAVAPALTPVRTASNVAEYAAYWGGVAGREAREAFGESSGARMSEDATPTPTS